MNDLLTKEQRTDLEKQIDSRWDEVLGMKPIKPSIFIPDDLKIELKNEYIRVIKEIVFIKKAKIIHGDKYDYRFVYYNDWKTKVIIVCPKHGEFLIRPNDHLSQKQGCPKCAGKGLSNEEWIERFISIHGDKYNYDKFIFKGNHTKSIVTCPDHGDFLITPANHLQGKGCPKCSGRGLSNEEWVQRFREVHGDKYTYDKFVFKGYNIKSIVTCPIHGDFLITPSHHLNGGGCCKCAGMGFSTEEWIDRFKEVHGDKYNYDKFVYRGNHTKSIVTCPQHGDFLVTPSSHLSAKSGCPKCNQSKGEIQIENYLKQNNIKYEIQKKFDDCKHKLPLPFDFYLPDHNILIEFQGEQHYKPVKHFGGEKKFKQNQKNDQIKRDFCNKPENPSLIEIKYTKINNINEILNEILKL